MRGLLPGLPSPHPLADTLPGIYREDTFVRRLCDGLDPVLAPVLLTLDCLPAYLDPDTAPPDVLRWLAAWIGVGFEEGDPPDRRRLLMRSAVDGYGLRGTVEGIRSAVRAVFDVDPEVEESGGVGWSRDPAAPLPGSAAPTLVVRLWTEDPSTVDVERLDTVVRAAKPAHVLHRVEVGQRAQAE
jgi:phage tail-like protein